MPYRPNAVARLFEQLVRQATNASHKADLTPAQWHALRYFSSVPQPERTVSGFVEASGVTAGTSSQVVQKLVGKGYLIRQESKTDRRVKFIQVTDAGRRAMTSDPTSLMAGLAEALSEGERRTLVRAMSRILEGLSGRTLAKPPKPATARVAKPAAAKAGAAKVGAKPRAKARASAAKAATAKASPRR